MKYQLQLTDKVESQNPETQEQKGVQVIEDKSISELKNSLIVRLGDISILKRPTMAVQLTARDDVYIYSESDDEIVKAEKLERLGTVSPSARARNSEGRGYPVDLGFPLLMMLNSPKLWNTDEEILKKQIEAFKYQQKEKIILPNGVDAIFREIQSETFGKIVVLTNDSGGIELDDIKKTSEHIFMRMLYAQVVLGIEKVDTFVENKLFDRYVSELLSADFIKLFDQVNNQIKAAIESEDPEAPETIEFRQLAFKQSIKKISKFLVSNEKQILALQRVIEDPEQYKNIMRLNSLEKLFK